MDGSESGAVFAAAAQEKDVAGAGGEGGVFPAGSERQRTERQPVRGVRQPAVELLAPVMLHHQQLTAVAVW